MAESATTFTTDELFSLLARSGLLNDKLFEAQKVRLQDSNSTPKSILSQMLSEHLLTPFQAKQLGERRHRGFFLSEKYKILEFLGQGGMSRVLLCEHLLLQRLVAVKILNKSLDKFPGAAERFLREARASASMDHPNIARVFDIDQTGLGPAIVMEYVDGMNLHDVATKRDLLAINRVAHLISQAATGLQQAHQVGLVHRDVKPANLMLDRTGTVKLLDLGLARFFDPTRSDNLTQQIDASCIIGTADYIAPEQVMESSSVDIRADIYSLGYTMYFLLTRTLPAGTGPAMRKLLWHQTRDPDPIRSLRPEIPEEMAAVLGRMIRKKPEERYQTPAEVVAALAPWTSIPIDLPSHDEMPRNKATSYRLGLCPPPDSSKVAGAAATVPPVKNAISPVSNKDSSLAKPRPAGSAASRAETSSESNIGYTNPQDAESLETANPKVPSADTNEVMSAGTDTANTTGSSYIRGLAATLPSTNQHGSGLFLAALGMVFALGLGILATHWWSSGQSSPRSQTEIALRDSNSNPSSISESTAATDSKKSMAQLASTGTVLRGGGSTFIRPAMEVWSRVYAKQTGVKIEYSAVGSTKGVDGLISNFLDFTCTDALLSEEQMAEVGSNVIHIPLAMGAVVPAYNVTNESGESLELRFTGAMLANIYLGKVKRWDDPAIAVSNPGLTLPDMPITVVFRKDGSGTTAIWTEYLSKTNSTWKGQIGVGNKVTWPIGIGAEKNDGVADTVSRTVGSIGYVELSYALANGLSVGQVKNQSGAFVGPSVESITSAVAASLSRMPTDLRYSLTDAPGTGSYPIIGTCWAVFRVDQASERGASLVRFLQWITSEGQTHLAGLHYGRLPAEVIDRIKSQLDQINVIN